MFLEYERVKPTGLPLDARQSYCRKWDLMDFNKTLRELALELERVDNAIAALEKIQNTSNENAQRLGRKAMDAEEREEVSKRMKNYWASRRRAAAAGGSQ